jgi:hypothetical protein
MKYRNPWLDVGIHAWSLGVESSQVIGLRTLKLATGGAAGEREARQMVGEKIQAVVALQVMALTGGLGINPHAAAAKAVTHYRRKVRANRRRLSRD